MTSRREALRRNNVYVSILPNTASSQRGNDQPLPPHPVVPSGPWARMSLGLKIGTIPLIFILALVIIEVYTYQSIRKLRYDARTVDVAARQRVLNERFVKQVLQTAEGEPINWKEGDLAPVPNFESTADILTNGGVTRLNIDTGEKGYVPPSTSEAVRNQLTDQKAAMEAMIPTAEAFQNSAPNSPERKALLKKLLDDSTALGKLANVTTKQISKDSMQAVDAATLQLEILAALVGLGGILCSWFITRQITQPLVRVVERAQSIGNSDLRGSPLPVTSTDDIGRLSEAFNTMQVGLRYVAAQSQESAESLSAAAAEILASAQEQAAGAGEQSAAVQQTTTTMEEISRSGAQITDKARQVASSAEATSAVSDAGLQAMQDSSHGMETIQQQAQAVAENIVALSEKTRAIGEIISTVNEIAEQSHLLALNAAIEAAGAGEQGRRFSVVADEMKHLADQSRDATVQVRSILSDIQRQIHTAVLLTEESGKRIENGKRQSDMAEATIRRMAASIIDSVNAFQQIVAAANQQQIGFEQVTQAAQQIRAAVDQTTVGTRQMETAAVNVNTLSQQLRKTVEAYQL